MPRPRRVALRLVQLARMALVALATLLVLTPRAAAYCQMTTVAGGSTPGICVTDGIPLRWERRCISYSLEAHGSADLEIGLLSETVRASFATWLDVRCGGSPTDFEIAETEAFSSCAEAQYRSDGGNVNTIAFVDDWAARGYDESVLVTTTVWHNTRTGVIYDVDMEINQAAGPFGVCPPEGCGGCPTIAGTQTDLQNVMTHEIGHFFGIGHSGVATSTMWFQSCRGETSRRSLEGDDIAALCSIYPPGSLPAECSFTPRGGLALSCGDDGGLCAISRGSGGGAPWGALLLTLLILGGRRSRRSRRRVD